MEQPIRILHVAGRMDRGGAETMIMNLYRNIDRNKVQFDFVVHTNKRCDYEDEIISLGGKIYKVPRYIGRNHLHYIKAWKMFFKEHPEYKIIHGHVRSTASIYLGIAKRNKLITISHSHNTSSGSGLSAIVKNLYQYRIRYIADYLFACSQVAGEWLFGKKACAQANFVILKNAIETRKFLFNKDKRMQKRKEFKVIDKFVIGHVGRFHRQKNHDFLIDVFKSVHDKNSNAILMLVGDGDLRPIIERKVRDLGLNNSVIFTGVRTDIPELLQAMDVFVFPSLYEGLPVTLVEAQAASLPTIISDKITREVKITELIKYISLDKNSDYWADKVLEYSLNNNRIDTYQKIVNAGYDIASVSNWYKDFMYEVLENE